MARENMTSMQEILSCPLPDSLDEFSEEGWKTKEYVFHNGPISLTFECSRKRKSCQMTFNVSRWEMPLKWSDTEFIISVEVKMKGAVGPVSALPEVQKFYDRCRLALATIMGIEIEIEQEEMVS